MLAKRVGVSRSWVIQAERGNAGAEVGLLFKALAALGLELDVRASHAVPILREAEDAVDLSTILNRARGVKR